MANAISLLPQIWGSTVAPGKSAEEYYWPESLNAAMALLTRQFFESTSATNLATIDSFEAVFKTQFQNEADVNKIINAEDYGRQVAMSIFEWSKTDGAYQAYKHIMDSTYIPPSGPGLWVLLSPAMAVHPHWGNNRSFITNSAQLTQPGSPIAYSEDSKSAFYQMVNELYTIP